MSPAIASSCGVVVALAGPPYGTISALFLLNTAVVVAGVGAGVVDEDIVVDFAASALPAAAAAVVDAAAAAGVAAAPGAAGSASAGAAGSAADAAAAGVVAAAGAGVAASASAAGSSAAGAAAAAAVGVGAADSAVSAAAAVAATAAAEAAAGAAAVGGSAFVDVVLLGSVGLASYPMGACMPLARRYLPLISTENPLGTWMMASEAARIHRYCPPQIEPILRQPALRRPLSHHLVVPAY